MGPCEGMVGNRTDFNRSPLNKLGSVQVVWPTYDCQVYLGSWAYYGPRGPPTCQLINISTLST